MDEIMTEEEVKIAQKHICPKCGTKLHIDGHNIAKHERDTIYYSHCKKCNIRVIYNGAE